MENNNAPLIHIHVPRFYNDKPLGGLFLFLFRQFEKKDYYHF